MNQQRIQWLHDLSTHWAAWMWEMSIQVMVLVLVILTINFFLRGRSARLRHSLWLVALIRLVIPPWLAAPTSLRWRLGPGGSQLN